MLSEQSAELSRLRAFVSDALTPSSDSELKTADIVNGAASTLFCYIKVVSARVLDTSRAYDAHDGNGSVFLD
jgi:hypothetical protein